MSFKVLLKKDWKQVSILWMLLVFLGVIAFTVPVWSQMQYFDQELRNIQENPGEYADWIDGDSSDLSVQDFFNENNGTGYWIGDLQSLIPMGGVLFLFVIFGALMASVLIGAERNSQMSDFTMSLPFTRNQLYISKWLIGTVGIIVSSVLGGTLMIMMIRFSDYAFLMEGSTNRVIALVVLMMLSGISFFSAALWMGSFGGESISQVIWTFIALIFPIGLIALVQGSVYAFSQQYDSRYAFFDDLFQSTFLRVLSPFSNLANVDMYQYFTNQAEWQKFLAIAPWSALAFIALSFGLGIWMFNRAPQENNGRFFMFSNWLWLIHIIMVLCFAMLGGIILSAFSMQSGFALYIVGFLIGGFIAHLLAKRLLYRFNLKLKS
ncbi:ABC transporter permease subunit [Exiguobacterium sp. s151]|uniref:ABC transporter permease subunit n=1 Tax=Exiguobacterium sp. s151 TaxID=2751229 RepID=UPI001BE83006